jgi:cobalt-zinc-cadmium resistance protein CzcA
VAKGLTKDKLTEQIQTEFNNELPGVVFNFSQYIEDNIEEGISGVKGVNSVKIVGPNLEVLTKLAEQVRDEMNQVRGIADLGIFPFSGNPTSTSRSIVRRPRAMDSIPAMSTRSFKRLWEER